MQHAAIVQPQHFPHIHLIGGAMIGKCGRNADYGKQEMAFVNINRAVEFGLFDRLQSLIETTKIRMARRAIYRQTVRELNALSAPELAQLGIQRKMIAQLAHEAAYGK